MAPEGHLSIFLGSPFSRMAQVLVREWRLPVTEAELPSFPPAEAFFAENPLGQVPVLAIGGERLFPTLIVLERLWRMGGSPEEAYRPDAERQFLATLLGGGDALVAATYQRWAGLGPVGPNHVGFDPGARNLARFVAVLDWADEGGRNPGGCDSTRRRARLLARMVGRARRAGHADERANCRDRRGPGRARKLPRDPATALASGGGALIFTVAIDGPAAAGKGTIGRAVAAALGFGHLDTGLLYRAVGVQALHDGRGVIDPHWSAELARRLVPEDLARDDLRTARAGQAASKVAALPEVRTALLAFQKRFARREGGAVLDGRDIGTVICPEAEAKLFVTAADEVRAARRFAELGSGTLEGVLADLRARDARDAARDVAPMVAAPDALLLDTSDLTIDAAVAEALAYVRSRMPGGA